MSLSSIYEPACLHQSVSWEPAIARVLKLPAHEDERGPESTTHDAIFREARSLLPSIYPFFTCPSSLVHSLPLPSRRLPSK